MIPQLDELAPDCANRKVGEIGVRLKDFADRGAGEVGREDIERLQPVAPALTRGS